MTSTLTLAPIPTHPSTGQLGWEILPQLAYQILLIPATQGLQQKGSPFIRPDIDAVKACMHVINQN